MVKRGIVKYEVLEKANGLIHDACNIIEQAQKSAYLAVNEMLIKRNWLLGMRIQYEVLKDQRAEYGKQIMKLLAESLVNRYGRGFSMRNLYYFVDFYQEHPDFFLLTKNILQASTAKSDPNWPLFSQMSIIKILQSLTAKSPIRLSWTHYNIIQQELTHEGRVWYKNEAATEMWSTRTLQRNVSSQYYHRLLQSPNQSVGTSGRS